MRTKIRLVAIIGAAALAALALASLPALAQDETGNDPALNHHPRAGGRVATLDRNYDGGRPVNQPVIPDKDVKPGRVAGAPNNPSNAGDVTGGFGASVVGGGSTSSSKTDRVERSLKSTAGRLR